MGLDARDQDDTAVLGSPLMGQQEALLRRFRPCAPGNRAETRPPSKRAPLRMAGGKEANFPAPHAVRSQLVPCLARPGVLQPLPAAG